MNLGDKVEYTDLDGWVYQATVIGKKESEYKISIEALGKVIKIDNSNSDRVH